MSTEERGGKHFSGEFFYTSYALCLSRTNGFVVKVSKVNGEQWVKAIIAFLLKWLKMLIRKEAIGVGNRIELSLGRRYPCV